LISTNTVTRSNFTVTDKGSSAQQAHQPKEPKMTTVETRTTRNRTMRSAADTEAAAYFEYLYGWGIAPGVDLGALGAYTKVPTRSGCVYRQNFERGIGLGNLGDTAAVVTLEHPYLDLDGNVVTSVYLPGHSVKALVNDH
jgi:hypothetical protein